MDYGPIMDEDQDENAPNIGKKTHDPESISVTTHSRYNANLLHKFNGD